MTILLAFIAGLIAGNLSFYLSYRYTQSMRVGPKGHPDPHGYVDNPQSTKN